MYATVAELTAAVLSELGLVPGSSVQTYTEPQILHNINTCFETLFSKRFWPHLTKTTLHELDGTTGVITDSSLVAVKDFKDIEWIRFYPYTKAETLVRLNGREFETGQFYSYDQLPFDHTQAATKVFNTYPLDFALPIKVRARRTPDPFPFTDGIVPFDKITMQHFVASNILASDGMNPNAQQRQTSLFEQRYNDMISGEDTDVNYYSRRMSNTFTVAEE